MGEVLVLVGMVMGCLAVGLEGASRRWPDLPVAANASSLCDSTVEAAEQCTSQATTGKRGKQQQQQQQQQPMACCFSCCP